MESHQETSAHDSPLVTVITATYNLLNANRAGVIHDCLSSVHQQTYPNIEHLIIDGASTDGTLPLLEEYEKKGWVRICSEADKGIYDAFNKGLQHAKGKYIAFLNSDDLWHDARGVEHSVRLLEQEQADFSYAPYREERKNGKVRTVDTPLSIFFYSYPCCHQTMFARTDWLRQLGGFNLNYKVCADHDIMVKLILNGAKPVRVPLVFTTFRIGGFTTDYPFHMLKREHWELYKDSYSAYISDETLTRVLNNELPGELRDILQQKIHPSLFKELAFRCQWLRKEQVWHFCAVRTTWGPFGKRCIDAGIFILNLLVPKWYERFQRLYRRLIQRLNG